MPRHQAPAPTSSWFCRLLSTGSSNDNIQPRLLWDIFTAQRRSISRQLRSDEDLVSSAFAPFPVGWDANLSRTLTTWEQHCRTYFTQMRVCSCCGAAELGGRPLRQTHMKASGSTGSTPPYAMSHFLMNPYTHAPNGHWWKCFSCLTSSFRSTYCSFWSPSYIYALMRNDAEQQQFLSVLDCRMNVTSTCRNTDPAARQVG